MSARDKILDLLFWAVPSSDDDEARAEAERLVNAFTHELAEEIREASLGMYPTGLCPAISGSREAANLIDPEVETPEYTRKHIEWHRDAWKVTEEKKCACDGQTLLEVHTRKSCYDIHGSSARSE